MVSNYINAYENTDNILANNMGNGKMAYISRDDCALAWQQCLIGKIVLLMLMVQNY